MESFNRRKKLTINLSLFTNLADSFSLLSNSTSPINKSPRTFQNNNSVVGLSIVAAMINSSNNNNNNNKDYANENISSSPIPISCSSSSAKKPRRAVNSPKQEIKGGVDELSESYTCVISHIGKNLVQKRVFFDDTEVDDDGGGDIINMENYSVFFASSSPPVNVGFEIKREFWSRDFLSSCFLCSKKLHGLDIFMYKGEKAFCSAECRIKHIASDDLKENCGSEARKQLDYSISPCSWPQPIFT